MKVAILVLAFWVAACQGLTVSGNKDVTMKLELKGSSLSEIIEQIRGNPTRYVGCYKDDSDRLWKDSWVRNNHMTIEWCINHCRKGNHKYAGLEYYSHCFCGQQLNTAKYPKMPESDCNTPCKGEPTQKCGGGGRLGIWKLK